MEKGVCPNCQQVVEVDLEQGGEICPHCQKGYVPHQAKRLFGLLYSQYASNGHIALNVSCNYPKALDEYTKLLKLDSGSVDAIFGIAHSRVANSTIDGQEVENVIALLSDNEEKILANAVLNDEIVQNFIALGKRIDAYGKACDEVLLNNNQYIDELAQERHQIILLNSTKYWEYIESFFWKHYNQYQEEIVIIKERISALRQEQGKQNDYVVIVNGQNSYSLIRNKAAFASKMSLFKLRLTVVIIQIVAVIGAIIGFSIMMANYSTNPFPGLIVFAVFAIAFIIANIIGRIIKNKLSK